MHSKGHSRHTKRNSQALIGTNVLLKHWVRSKMILLHYKRCETIFWQQHLLRQKGISILASLVCSGSGASSQVQFMSSTTGMRWSLGHGFFVSSFKCLIIDICRGFLHDGGFILLPCYKEWLGILIDLWTLLCTLLEKNVCGCWSWLEQSRRVGEVCSKNRTLTWVLHNRK